MKLGDVEEWLWFLADEKDNREETVVVIWILI